MKNTKKVMFLCTALAVLSSIPSFAGEIGTASFRDKDGYTIESNALLGDASTALQRTSDGRITDVAAGPLAPAYWEEDVAGVRYNEGNGHYALYDPADMNYTIDGLFIGRHYLKEDGSVGVEYGPLCKAYFEKDIAGLRYNNGDGTYAVNTSVTDPETGITWYFNENGYAVPNSAPESDDR